MNIDFAKLNFLAILIAVIFNQVFGALWYSPFLFGKKWMKEVGLNDEDIDRKGAVQGFIFAIIFSVVIYFIIALLITATGGAFGAGALIGFLLSVITAFQLGTNYVYENRSVKLYLINAFYPIICYTIGGGIIGIFQS